MTATISPVSDTRNVADEFKGVAVEQIRETLDTRRTQMVCIAQNLTSDFNKSSCVRNMNAFSGRKFIFLNRENEQNPDAPTGVARWDKRGAVGANHYEHIEHYRHDRWKEVFTTLRDEGYTIYAVDNIPSYNPVSVYTEQFPEKSVFVYGEEGLGLTADIINACDRMVYIPQTGSVRSLNIAVAHGIVSAFYTAQHAPAGT